jgi:hypothetical protein
VNALSSSALYKETMMKNEVTIKLGGVALNVRYTIDEPFEAQDIVIDAITAPGSTVDITDALHAAALAAALDPLAAEHRYSTAICGLVIAAAEAQAARHAADALADLAYDSTGGA